ncbi:MAG: RNase E specificity factor CsrD [Sodalis sp.]|uniref:hypothetical protein n=1 Tax=Sodalis sp. (in: enterobacteria) TaxID=1898979 RepID=UPI0038737460|nr:MAG: RNase E specificity factor CsrD [Sodalis sp.]
METSLYLLLMHSFRHWFRDTLMQCGNPCEAKLCLNWLRRISANILNLYVRRYVLLTGPVTNGCRAGITLIGTDYISIVPILVIKLHPSLVRDIARWQENQLFMQSLPEACNQHLDASTWTRVFATDVHSIRE